MPMEKGRAFLKMQGLGNHFVIVDARERPWRPSRSEAIRICDVRRGVGADQLLIVQPPSATGRRAGASAAVRIVNVDGTDAETCGNATRCVAWWLMEELGAERVLIETLGGTLVCERRGERRVSVEMGRICRDWRSIPLAEPCDTLHVPVANGVLRDGIALNIGNPHIVFFVDDLSAVDLVRLAPAIQHDPLFPQQVNVGVAEIVDERHLRLAVYERPGLLTSGCGSGACVAALAASLRGWTTGPRTRVEMAGGTLEIDLDENGSAVMSGPVDYCFTGNLPAARGARA
mgnify:CR=1 FL=1